MKVLVVGAGFSGAVVARALALEGHEITVVDERRHVGGNCHTEPDEKSGIMVHIYGPHIFHTNNQAVWDYVNQFGRMMPYVNRVKARVGDQIYSLPINLHTINQVYQRAMSPDEAQAFLAEQGDSLIQTPRSFEEQALKFVGAKLYEMFFKGYTRKQWGVDGAQLPASILKRLPVRFVYDDNYFNHRFQGIPEAGYTDLISNILDCDRVTVRLGEKAEGRAQDFDHVVYSGPLDRYFQHDRGRLQYRTLSFEKFHHKGDFQGTAVMNYCDAHVPFTRISEHKYFAPWHTPDSDLSVCFREYSGHCGPQDIPFYPTRLLDDQKLLGEYVARANQEKNVTFLGRLGTYSYLDMDVTIERALETASAISANWKAGLAPPVFVHDP